MEDPIKKIQLLDNFINYEKRSRRWTVISVIVFCVLGCAVFILSYSLNSSNAKYKNLNAELEKAYIDLDEAYYQLDIEATKDSASLARDNEKDDSLIQENGSLKILLKGTLQEREYTAYELQAMKHRILSKYRDSFPGKKIEEAGKIFQSVLTTKISTPQKEDKIVVYIEFMPDYKDQMSQVNRELIAKGFHIEDREMIPRISFDPVVRYFHAEDKPTAEKIVAYLNGIDGARLKKKFRTQSMEHLKAPLHQLEVWIGEYQKKDVDFKVPDTRQQLL